MTAVETLIVWENLPLTRLRIRNPHTGAEQVHFVQPEHELDERMYRCPDTGVELVLLESDSFVDWIIENYRNFATKLEFVSDRSHEGNQFCKGFGGIGGLLRYRIEFDAAYAEVESDVDDDFM